MGGSDVAGTDVAGSDAALASSPTAGGRRRRPLVAVLAILAVALVVGAVILVLLALGPNPTRGLPAWDQLDTRWGTYLSEREWGTPREAVDSDG